MWIKTNTGWSFYGYVSTIDTLRGSSLVTGFDWDTLFIWDLSWFNYLSFFWTTHLTVTLRGTGEGMAFLNISARVLNASLCPFSDLTSGLASSGLCSV